MGKRELLLIVGFIVLGAVVYHATAPPGETNAASKWSQLVDHIKREIRGNPASAEITKSDVHALAATTKEIRITGVRQVVVTGGDRKDIASELQIWSDGADDAEANKLASEVTLVLRQAAGSAAFEVKYPQPGTQRATLVLRVPSRLHVQVTGSNQRQEISGVASVEGSDIRGETTIAKVSGRVALNHRGGRLNIADAGVLKVTSRGSEVRLDRITGDAVLQLQSGELQGAELTGALEIDANSAEVTIEKLQKARGPIRVTANGGRVRLRGLGSDARVESRNTDIEVEIDRAAPIAIYGDGEDVEVTPPAGGYELDALASGGELSIAEASIKVHEGEDEQRASGAVRGGGPLLTVRVTRGDIRVRAPESEKPVERTSSNPPR